MMLRGPLALLALLASFVTASLLPQRAHAQDDPDHLWLEEVHSARAMAWVAERNAETEARFRNDPRYAAEVERYRRYAQGAGRDEYLGGGYAHQVVRDADHPLGTWRAMRVDRPGTPQWRDVLSLDALAQTEGTRWQFRPGWLNPTCDARLGTRCLVALSPDGGDRTVLREFDLATGRFVDGGYATTAPARSVVAWIDRDTVLIASDFGPGTMSDAGYAMQARVWKRGEALANARVIFQAPSDAVLFITHAMRSGRSSNLLAEVWRRGAPTPEYWRMALDRPAEKLALPTAVVQYRGVIGALGERLIITTAAPATIAGRSVRPGALLAVRADGRGTPEVVFEPSAAQAIDPIFHLAMARDSLWFVAMKDVDAHLYSATRQRGRWRITEHALPPHAAVQLLTAENTQGVVMAKVESLLQPPTTMLFGTRLRAPLTIATTAPLFDATCCVTEQHFATSRDGTRVPYYLVHRRDFVFDGRAAGLVSAYGGFGVSWLPSYANHEFKTDIGRPIVERGGVFVHANIRGGGEYGPLWHAGARRALRQNGLDDLAAIARDLVRIGATAPDRLAMIGGSNGGLLAAATGIQSPELFRALIADVPLTDMLRYTKLYTGAVWINEYGDPEDPVEGAALARYSPLQNVHAGVRYPEMLLVTSTADDRVHPSHARRLAERLRSVGSPVLFYESAEGGHESLASLQKQAELRALETVYLLQALKID